MTRLQKGLILLVGGSALVFSLAFAWNARRELQVVRRELLALTTANEFLKSTLGEMTVAITTKDREIDRLQHSGCEGQEKARMVECRRYGARGLIRAEETAMPVYTLAKLRVRNSGASATVERAVNGR